MEKDPVNTTIGAMNGKWSIPFRVGMVLVPILVVHATWLTTSMYSVKQFQAVTESNRFTSQNGAELRRDILNMMAEFNRSLAEHASIPGHKVMVERVSDWEQIKRDVADIKLSVTRMEERSKLPK